MNKLISRKAHGAADYTYAAVAAALPALVGFAGEEKANLLTKTVSCGTLAYTLLTRAEWGLLKIIPFKAHLAIDFTAGIFILTAPWIFKFAENTKARNTFLALGLTSIAASLLTQPEEMAE